MKTDAVLRRVNELHQAVTASVLQLAITERNERLIALQERWDALSEAQAALAREDYAAAMKTGVVLRKKRWVGGKEGQAVTEYEINTALIESLNSVEKRAAIETGQEVDRQDINLRKANDQVEALKRAFSFEELRAMQDRMQATIDADQGKAVPLADIIDLKPVLEAGDSRQGARNGRAKIAGPLLQSLLAPDVCSRRPGDAAQHLAVGGGFSCRSWRNSGRNSRGAVTVFPS